MNHYLPVSYLVPGKDETGTVAVSVVRTFKRSFRACFTSVENISTEDYVFTRDFVVHLSRLRTLYQAARSIYRAPLLDANLRASFLPEQLGLPRRVVSVRWPEHTRKRRFKTVTDAQSDVRLDATPLTSARTRFSRF